MDQSLNCIIIDDEKKDRENLCLLLQVYCPFVTVIGEANDRESIIDILSRLKPDLVFMDIQLGTVPIFEILNNIDYLNFRIVFVTAHDKYAIRGYQYDAIDYLLKPIEPKRLVEAVNKMVHLKSMSSTQKNIIKEFHAKAVTSPKISITDARGVHMVETIDILYCMSNGNYTIFILVNEREIVISKNLKHFEVKLKTYDFLRIHKSYLINVNHIDFMVKEQGGYVVMKNGKSLPVSKNGKKELYERMNIL
ncbi:LytR/AlgR family response regulator transcription factor [uncultured Croceitalea sp.]|uniref:LytR/AlgR family response regulator transcription factor n=1 Tax=uncultured Croceitalea sp. TaxID=1798908 RepID=UPI00374F0647